MRWLILFVLGVVFAEEEVAPGLGDQILSTEQECARLYTLNEHWNANKMNDRAILYVNLFFLCEESLVEDKLAYIQKNHIDLTKYSGDHFPVTTSKGLTDFIDKPPVQSKDEMIDPSIKNKLKGYLQRFGGKLNPMYKLSVKQSKLNQEIVNQQISCELKAIMVNKHPEVAAMRDEHTQCMDKLNCLKERFIEEHGFTLEKYPDYIPIMYKGRGVMINSPPQSEGKSLCLTPVHSDNYKSEMKKWDMIKNIKRVQYMADRKIENIEDAGTELIKRLKEIGMRGGVPLMTKKQLDKLMDNVESITVVEDDGTERKDQPKIDLNAIRKSAKDMTETLHELENNGKNFMLEKLDKLNEIKPEMESLSHLTTRIDQVKMAEANKIKMAIKKTMKGLSDKEAQLSKTGEGLKESISLATQAEKQAALTLKRDSSILVEKLKSKLNVDLQKAPGSNVENDNDHPGGWLGDLAHTEFDKIRKADVDTLLAKFGHKEGDKDLLSEDHFLELLNNIKKDIKEKAKNMNIHSKDVKQAGVVIKGALYSVLNAAKHGHGPAKGMTNKEIHDAKFMVNKLVDFATTEIFPNEEEEDDENDVSSSKEDKVNRKDLSSAIESHPELNTAPRLMDLTDAEHGEEVPSTTQININKKESPGGGLEGRS